MGSRKTSLGEDVDLLGDPLVPLRDPRGRKSIVGSSEIRKQIQMVVMQCVAAGMNADQVAEVLGHDPKTVRKYFSRELQFGATLMEALAMQVLAKRMLEGNVTAAKEVLAISRAASAPKARAPKAAAVGKKEQQARAASAPPQGWGDLLDDASPKLPN